MPDPIRDVRITNYRLDPHETELRVRVEIEGAPPATEIRGRLVGPCNTYASTVEVAYPMREVARDGRRIGLRVVISEPVWWEPATPFLYQGPLELWRDGQLLARENVVHGIRHIAFTTAGFQLNGRPFKLRGKEVKPTIDEDELVSLHATGVNVILTRLDAECDWRNSTIWRRADKFGMFVLCWTQEESDADRFNLLSDLFACALGRIEAPGGADSESSGPDAMKWTGGVLPPGASILVCRENALASLGHVSLSKLVLVDRLPESPAVRPDVIGWIETAP